MTSLGFVQIMIQVMVWVFRVTTATKQHKPNLQCVFSTEVHRKGRYEEVPYTPTKCNVTLPVNHCCYSKTDFISIHYMITEAL